MFRPFADAVRRRLDWRTKQSQPTIIVGVHSFTPVYSGTVRPWHAGVLYGEAKVFGRALIAALEKETGLIIGDNEPYNIHPDEDYTVPTHADSRGLPGFLIEVRHDLIETLDDVAQWGRWLTSALSAVASA
ncbi:N-formylglutamate amidohydrolase family protein [Brucella lupini]|uniref:N-formylglutamate amidohydrolase family protein n=1 Tax=Brucella lupini TaxID=255457 RepID=A0A256GYW6_9HYPH|nr:N-formylglutamate amidohydrolase family protein [Brucella lupini]